MMLSLNLSASKTVQNRKLLSQGWWKRWGPGCLMVVTLQCGLLSSIVLRAADRASSVVTVCLKDPEISIGFSYVCH